MPVISHAYSQTVADGTATSVVRPSDWNSGHNQLYTVSGNTTGGSTASGTNVIFAASGNISLSASSDTIWIGGTQASLSHYSPPWAYSGMATNSSLGQSTLYFQPFDVPAPVSGSRINFYISASIAGSVSNQTATGAQAIGYALYTRGTGTNTDRISRLTSYAMTHISLSQSSNTQWAYTNYAGLLNTTSHSTVQTGISATNASTYNVTSINGPRAVGMPLNLTLTPGRYWLGVSVQTVSSSAAVLTNGLSVFQTSVGVQPDIRPFGVNSAATNASVYRLLQGWGSYSAQSAAWPDSIALTTDAIRAPVAQTLVHFHIAGYTYNASNP